jgi:outer membrane protein TolC
LENRSGRSSPACIRTPLSSLTLFIILFALASSGAYGQILTLDPTLRRNIDEAVRNNPDLLGWSSRVSAAEHRVSRLGAWPDPTLKFSLANLPTNTFAFDQEPMTAAWISLEQRIPIGGKSSAQKAVASSDVESYGFGQLASLTAVAAAIAGSWYKQAYLSEAIRILTAELEIMDDFIAVARRKYETGGTSQQDVLRAQTRRSQLEDRLLDRRQMLLTERRRLAFLMGRDPGDPPEPPHQLPQNFGELDKETLLNQMLGDNPAIGLAGAEFSKAEHMTTLAGRSWWPDLMIGVGYGFRQDSPEGIERPDFFSITAGVTLPVFGHLKQSPQVQETQAVRKEMLYRQRSTELQLRFEIENLLDQDTRLAAQIQLYVEGIEPQAEATFSAAATDYTVGRVDFEAVLLAETELYSARLDRLARILDRLSVRVGLAALVNDQDLVPNLGEEN